MTEKDPRMFAHGQYWKYDQDGDLVPDTDTTDDTPVQATATRLDREPDTH